MAEIFFAWLIGVLIGLAFVISQCLFTARYVINELESDAFAATLLVLSAIPILGFMLSFATRCYNTNRNK